MLFVCAILDYKENFMVRVLFVCTGATCRGPMAGAIARFKIKKKNIKGLTAFARGLFVVVGSEVEKKAKRALSLLGVDEKTEKPTELTQKDLDIASIVFVFTNEQKEVVKTKYKNTNHVFTLAEFVNGVNIEDPYGRDEAFYFKTARYLDFAIEEMLEVMFREGFLK